MKHILFCKGKKKQLLNIINCKVDFAIFATFVAKYERDFTITLYKK